MPVLNPYKELAERLVAALPDTVVLQLNGLMLSNRKRLSKEIEAAFARHYPKAEGRPLIEVFADSYKAGESFDTTLGRMLGDPRGRRRG